MSTANLEISLSTPIDLPKGRLEKLTLRQPTLRTLKRAGGNYLRTYISRDEEGRAVVSTDYDMVRLAATIVELSVDGLDEISVEDLSASDIMRAGNTLAGLFAGM